MKGALPYQIVDAFSSVPYLGNPVAIVRNADELEASQMQTIARHFNLSETAFLCAPQITGADYRVRIFTPRSELPFAGHPSIGAAFVHWSSSLRRNSPPRRSLVQECLAGLVPIAVSECGAHPLFQIATPRAERLAVSMSGSDIERMLGVKCFQTGPSPPEICSAGLAWLIVEVDRLTTMRSLAPDLEFIEQVCRSLDVIGLTVYCREAHRSDCQVHARSFAPGEGAPEDPVCGSGNAAAALHLAAHHAASATIVAYRAEQGVAVGRRGVLHLRVDRSGGRDQVFLGGHAVTIMTGELAPPARQTARLGVFGPRLGSALAADPID